MMREYDVRKKLVSLLNDDIEMEDFESWLVSQSWDMHKRSSMETQKFVSMIELLLAEFSNSHISQDALRKELEALVNSATIEARLSTGLSMRDWERPRATANSDLARPAVLASQPALA